MKTMILALTIAVALIGPPLLAQEEGEPEAVQAAGDEAAPKIAAAMEEGAGKLLRAIRLPAAAEQARREGVPAGEVKKVLEAARAHSLPAGETEAIMVEETRAVREEGRVDNFGSFVESKLNQGLRGRELSEAIRAEHAARGKGKGRGKAEKGNAGRSAAIDAEEEPANPKMKGKEKRKPKQDKEGS